MWNVKLKCGIATKLVMVNGDISEEYEAMVTRLAHGIHDNALSLRLYLCVVSIGWLSQLKSRQRNKLLKEFPIDQVPRVYGKKIHGCSSIRTPTD